MPRMRSATPSDALFTHLFLKVDAVQLRKIIKFHETLIKFKGFALSAGALENLQKGYKTMPQILLKQAKISFETCRKACPNKALEQVERKTGKKLPKWCPEGSPRAP